jgi:homoserine dehydrogenase
MSTALPGAAAERPRLALFGTGVVGSAFIGRYLRLRARGLALPDIGWLCNSRVTLAVDHHDPLQLLQSARSASALKAVGTPLELLAGDIVIDATASEAAAAQHLAWLQRGVHVVTANKLGNGAGLQRAQAIAKTVADGDVHYGDAATVGAGLPLLRSVRALVAGGDRIIRIEGVLSGSLAWLFSQYDGMRPFSGFVRQAREAGYTEPDPRIDLSGEDVRRKLLILARAAGQPLQAEDVQVSSLVPASLAALPLSALDAALGELDVPLSAYFAQAHRNGARLRFIGRFAEDGASVGVQALPADHPLCGGSGTDNKVAIFSDRYAQQPLLIQGPGAGAEVTAAALLDDVLAISAR